MRGRTGFRVEEELQMSESTERGWAGPRLGQAGKRRNQREVRKTRELARTELGLPWLVTDWKFGGGGSCKVRAVPPAYARSCQAVIWGVHQLKREGLLCNVLYQWHSLHYQYLVTPLVFLTSLWEEQTGTVLWEVGRVVFLTEGRGRSGGGGADGIGMKGWVRMSQASTVRTGPDWYIQWGLGWSELWPCGRWVEERWPLSWQSWGQWGGELIMDSCNQLWPSGSYF